LAKAWAGLDELQQLDSCRGDVLVWQLTRQSSNFCLASNMSGLSIAFGDLSSQDTYTPSLILTHGSMGDDTCSYQPDVAASS
jgi:hypothetical protein